MSERTELIMEDTARLVRFSSPSGKEQEIAGLVFTGLREMGHKEVRLFGGSTITRNDDLSKASSVGVLIPGKNRKGLFVANGHLDTIHLPSDVPPSMMGSLTPEKRGDWLYGRGAGDMKAGAAVMLDIARQCVDKQPPCDIFLSFVDQEETNSRGSLVQARWIHDNLSQNYPEGIGGVILEPTYREGDGGVRGFAGFGHRGGTFINVTAEGESGHGGKDYSGSETAIGTLVNFLHALPAIQKSWQELYRDRYGVPTLNTGTLNAGRVANLVPPVAYANLDLRTTELFVPEWLRIRRELERDFNITIQPAEDEDVDLAVSFCDPSSRVYQTVEEVMPGKFDVFPYGSDQPVWKRHGIPMVIYGPGDVDKLHGPEDRVHSKAVEECRQNIGDMIEVFANY